VHLDAARLQELARRKDMLRLGGASHRQNRRVLEQQNDVADLAPNPLALELLLKTKRFGVVEGTEATKQHGTTSGS
jgi:hypothetical protein